MTGGELLMAAICGVGLAAVTVGADRGPGAYCRRWLVRQAMRLPRHARRGVWDVSKCVLCSAPYCGLVMAAMLVILPMWGDAILAGVFGAPGLLWMANRAGGSASMHRPSKPCGGCAQTLPVVSVPAVKASV